MNTKALVTMMASIIAANAVLAADLTVEEDTRLSADETVDGVLTVASGGISLCRNHVEQVKHVELSACSYMICMVNQVWKIRKVQEQ